MNSKSKRLAQITVLSLIWSASSLADVSSPQNPGYENRWPRCNEAEGRCYCGTASQCKDMVESGVCKADRVGVPWEEAKNYGVVWHDFVSCADAETTGMCSCDYAGEREFHSITDRRAKNHTPAAENAPGDRKNEKVTAGRGKAPAPEAAIEDKDENESEKRRVRDQRK